ncbi:hypothetical protein CSIV_05160 [Microbacterium sp. CSI-V]|nr:hypothetical protein CSIV_05160 [Microbacterium sp. CSI-V]
MREFFRAEEDARLGRWRVPGSPNWTCYPTENTYEVVVFNEDEPQYGSFRLDRGGDTWPYARAAAEAYFDAHPEPKPWHDAKPGEVWVIVTRNVGDERAVQVYGDEFYYNDGVAYPITYDAIESARRIWPEPAV